LLGNLFLFDGWGVLLHETQLCDRHIIKHDVEIFRSFCQCFLHQNTDQVHNYLNFLGDFLSHFDELVCIILCHHCFEHLISDGWQDLLVIVDTNIPWKVITISFKLVNAW
jgi:hypothetical protein